MSEPSLAHSLRYLRQHVALLVPQPEFRSLLCLTLRYFVAAFNRNPLRSFSAKHLNGREGARTLIIPQQNHYATQGGIRTRLMQKEEESREKKRIIKDASSE